MENALQTLTVLPENKREFNSFFTSAKAAILNGYNNPLEVLKKVKILQDLADKLRKDVEIKEYIELETDKYTEKTIESFNCEFQKRELPQYDFSVCEDSELEMMENEHKRLTSEIKARKEFLKVLKDNYINQETGEVIKPPVKSIKSSIAVKIK